MNYSFIPTASTGIDAHISYDSASAPTLDVNAGGEQTQTVIVTEGKGVLQVLRIVNLWNISTLPAGQLATNAYIDFVSRGIVTSAVSLKLRRLIYTDFTDAGVTWNSRVHGSLLWDTPTDPASWLANTSATNEMSFTGPSADSSNEYVPWRLGSGDANFKALVNDAIVNRSGLFAFVIYAADEDGTPAADFDIWSSDCLTLANRPRLVIEIGSSDAMFGRGRGRGRGR